MWPAGQRVAGLVAQGPACLIGMQDARRLAAHPCPAPHVAPAMLAPSPTAQVLVAAARGPAALRALARDMRHRLETPQERLQHSW